MIWEEIGHSQDSATPIGIERKMDGISVTTVADTMREVDRTATQGGLRFTGIDEVILGMIVASVTTVTTYATTMREVHRTATQGGLRFTGND